MPAPAPASQAAISAVLNAAANLLMSQGIWRGTDTFAAPDGYPDQWDALAFADAGPHGALDPIAALWLAVESDLPAVFTSPDPADVATAIDRALAHRLVGPAVTALSDSLLAPGRSTDPIERIALWLDDASDSEVIGRLMRLSDQLSPVPAPAAPAAP